MRRLCLLLMLAPGLLVGCSGQPDRKPELEKWLPGYVTTYARRHWPPRGDQLDRIRVLCNGVQLVKTSEGHYTGQAHFLDGGHPKIEVVDDGKNIQFKLETVNEWGKGRVPPVD